MRHFYLLSMRANVLTTCLAIFLFASCSEKADKEFTLVRTDSLSFELDSYTKNDPFNYSLYTDNGETYFTFQNRNSNNILFYDLNSREFKFMLSPSLEGNNGVGYVSGYYIHNLDSIYLTNLDLREISLIDRNRTIISKYKYEKDHAGKGLSLFSLTSAHYKPAQQIGRTLYFYSGPNRYVEKDPVSITFDMDHHSLEALPFYYPDYPGSDIKLKKYGLENTYSRCFDGERFVYSFYYDENIYVASPSHDSIQKVKIKSKYFDKVQLPDELTASPQDFCTNAWYGNLFFDKYRNVYYRIAYPATEGLSADIRPVELYAYGRKNFSIIIIDKDFNVIGERLFPDFTYNSWIIFVNESGLYISSSHYLNPDFNDDVLSFHKFELEPID